MKKERKKNAKERSSSSYIKEFIPYYKPYKKLLFFDMLCSAIATAVELVFPSFAQRITNEAIDVGYVVLRTVLIYGVILLALRSVEVACRFFVNKYGHIMGVKIESDLRRNLFGRFQLLSHGFYDENKVGSLMSRITTDLFDITEFSHHCPETLFISGLKLIGIFTILMIQQPLMTLCVFAIIPVMAWLTVLFNGRWDKVWQKNRHNQSEINAQVEDTLSGIRVVKSFANEDIEQQKFDRGNKELVKSKSEVYHYMGVFFASLRGMDAVMYVFILILGGLFKIDAGLFVAYLLYATVLMSTLISFADYSEQFERGITAFKRYQQIMDTPVSPADKEDAAELKDVQGNVRFDNVTFSYSKDGKKVLDKLNLTINKGEIVALVGPSGGGKTTIAGLIPRFYDVTEGAVTVDGIDVRDVTMNSLRKNIGMVQQDVYLFWGTVAENIAYGKPDARARKSRKPPKCGRGRIYTHAARRIRKLCGRKRRQAERRAKTAHFHSAGISQKSPDNNTRRGYKRVGQRKRGQGSAIPRQACQGTHVADYRAQAVHHTQRHKNHSNNRKGNTGAGHARRADGARRHLQKAVRIEPPHGNFTSGA